MSSLRDSWELIRGGSGLVRSPIRQQYCVLSKFTNAPAADNILSDPEGPFPNFFAAYGASKVKAHHAGNDFIEKECPHFSVAYIFPSFVIGKNELARTTEAVSQGSNSLLTQLLLGGSDPFPLDGATVHVDDVAYTHVKSLDPSIEGNQKFICNSGGVEGSVWEDANDIVGRKFPDAVKEGILPLGGSQATSKIMFDTSRTEKLLGVEFKDWEEQVVSLVGWYIENAQKAQG